MRHLLDITDFTADEITHILDLAEQPPASLERPLDGEGVALIFEKPSNRTRHSMEMAVVQLGGHPVYTRGEEVGFDVREPVEDIGRVMGGYHGILAARVFSHRMVERLAAVSPVPVVNMLSDHSHPLQGFADALTMRQHLGELTDKRVAWVGDYNNVTRSLAEISAMLGMHVAIATPEGFGPSADELARIEALGARSVSWSTHPSDAVEGAHAVHTDTWVSMGQEEEKEERLGIFSGYTVDEAMMAQADDSAVFMHCLPAYRDIEVAAEVIDGPASVVVDQAHNRLHSARAALAFLANARGA